MKNLIIILMLSMLLACSNDNEAPICAPDECIESEVEIVTEELPDMVFKDGKFISTRQMRAVKGE